MYDDFGIMPNVALDWMPVNKVIEMVLGRPTGDPTGHVRCHAGFERSLEVGSTLGPQCKP